MNDAHATPLPPGRAEVAARWQALARGEVTREAVHAWAVPWVEGEGALVDFEDPLVLTALQYLHGFDLCRDPGAPGVLRHGTTGEGEWYRSPDDVAAALTRWRANCALHDEDPAGWIRAVRERARAAVRAEEEERGRDTPSVVARTRVHGVLLPAQLTSLLGQGRWRHPGDAAMARSIPWFEDPLDFLTSTEQMARESRSMDRFAADASSSALFREVRGSDRSDAVELPWLDVEQAVLVAVNRRAGDDVALALDYRTDPADPRVVGSDFWTDPRRCEWRQVAPTFSAFVHALGL
ncbi:hypothetical protein ACFWAR_30750 [Streptomyces sp. NPDC059917]|uniref:hypothetical protein n=1 Tax=Streptomyces sp. NPDC059917 TaxID=3347002 RepID=UPI003647CC17